MVQPWRILVVGGGSIGERHIRCFLATGRVEAAICDTNVERRKQLVDRYPLAASFSSLDESASFAPEIAVVATPAHLHVEQAIWLAERGVHLLIEKPLSTTFELVDELRAVVAKNSLVAGVGYVYRAHPALIAMKAAITSGRWGSPRQFIVVAGQHFPTYRPQYRDIYYADRAQGGGAIQDALTHLLDCGEWLAGPIDRACADADHMALPGVTVEDTVAVLTRQRGAMGSYILNQHQAADEMTMTVVCERGMCRFENHLARWRWIDGVQGPWTDEPTPLRNRDELYQRQADAFLNAVEQRSFPPCDLADGVSAFVVCQAVLASWRENRWVIPERR